MRTSTSRKSQQGVATLLFVVFVALGLMAATGAAFQATNGAQKLQHAEHTVTQAEMTAWAGVALLSKAVAALPPNPVLPDGGDVVFEGAQPGLSARYLSTREGLFVFEVIGSSAGARSVLRVAIRPPAEPEGGSGDVRIPGGATLHGTTFIEGSVNYSGSQPRNLYVLDGPLTLQGSVTGLERVCATGDIDVGAAISVSELCTNGNVVLKGSATVATINAQGNVTLQGGAASAIGRIHSNGAVNLSGGSATSTTVQASGDVAVTGGNARVNDIQTEGSVNWTSSAAAASVAANGTVNYRASGTTVNTDISAIGNVMLTSARNVRTRGATTLVGYWGQGITGRLDSEGLLGGSSWGSGGGAVVKAGTVGSVVTPRPSTVVVTVAPGYVVAVNAVVVPEVPRFEQPKITVDAYALKPQANLSFLGVDGSGNARVTLAHVNGVADGDYFIANSTTGGQNFLCKQVSGPNCVAPLIKVCQGYSNQNRCFSHNGGRWTIEGTTMLPWVLWFEGNLTVSNGRWANTFLATGDISTGGSLKVFSPNYPASSFTCRGQSQQALSLPAWSDNGLASGAYPSQLCTGSPASLKGAAIGNIAMMAGGLNAGTFVGGNVDLGSSNEIYGSILAGQYLNTGGSTTVAGTLYSAAQGGSTAKTSNRQGGSTTIRVEGGAPAYDPDLTPCMANCGTGEAPAKSNVVWAAPA